MPRAIKFFILLPVITFLWGAANSIGVTTMLAKETGLPDINTWEIPGLAELVQIRELTGGVADEAKEQARKAAIKAVKAEVRRRYGPEAAGLIPDDMNRKQARNFDFKQFEKTLDTKLPDGVPTKAPAPQKPKPTKAPAPQKPKPTKAPAGGTVYATALTTLGSLDVKGKAPMTGYDRDEFGSEWSDAVGDWKGWSRNGCDTRNDALRRDLGSKAKIEPGTNGCKVISGTFKEPFSGQSFDFIAGNTSMDHSLDIDHIVALGATWVTGSYKWTEDKRALIANDPLNLWAVSASLNRQKSDADAATWLPPNKAIRCDYITAQVQVKAKYDLWVTTAEKDAMTRVLQGCV